MRAKPFFTPREEKREGGRDGGRVNKGGNTLLQRKHWTLRASYKHRETSHVPHPLPPSLPPHHSPPAYLVTSPTMMPPAAFITIGKRVRGLRPLGKEKEGASTEGGEGRKEK